MKSTATWPRCRARFRISFGGGLEAENWDGGRIQRNVFSGNVASQTGIGRGGGASLWGTSDARVTDNAFTGNAAALAERSGAGGGLFLLNTQTMHLTNNAFQDNLALASGEGHGGGLCVWSEPYNSDLTADANLFLGNRATADSGGSFHRMAEQATLTLWPDFHRQFGGRQQR